MKYHNYPIETCAKTLHEIMQPGMTFYQKWTCEKCGDRVTGNTPNKLFTSGHHEDCGHTTDLTRRGCNYVIMSVVKSKECI
jgi:hypothetical protein